MSGDHHDIAFPMCVKGMPDFFNTEGVLRDTILFLVATHQLVVVWGE